MVHGIEFHVISFVTNELNFNNKTQQFGNQISSEFSCNRNEKQN